MSGEGLAANGAQIFEDVFATDGAPINTDEEDST